MIKLDLPTIGEIRHLFKEGILTNIKYSFNKGNFFIYKYPLL